VPLLVSEEGFCPPSSNLVVQYVSSFSAYFSLKQWRTQEFCSGGGGGVQQIQLRTEDRENRDLGAVVP